MKNILLFGASGFLGTHLKEMLSENVVPVSLRTNNWKENLSDEVSVYINCIGKAHDHSGKGTKEDFYHANYDIVKSLFQSFIESKASLFIHISSIAAVEEYERTEIINEESECFPTSYYGKSKKAAEDYLLHQDIPKDKKIIILRPTMIHGEGDKGNLSLLHKIISKGIPYPLGAFDNLRTFISVDNVVYFIEEIIKKEKYLVGGVYNIADDESVSTKNIINIIGRIRNKKPIIISLPVFLVNFIGVVGNLFGLSFNTKRLKKMTSNLIVSNKKIKKQLGIKKLPQSSINGFEKTIKSF